MTSDSQSLIKKESRILEKRQRKDKEQLCLEKELLIFIIKISSYK